MFTLKKTLQNRNNNVQECCVEYSFYCKFAMDAEYERYVGENNLKRSIYFVHMRNGTAFILCIYFFIQ